MGNAWHQRSEEAFCPRAFLRRTGGCNGAALEVSGEGPEGWLPELSSRQLILKSVKKITNLPFDAMQKEAD